MNNKERRKFKRFDTYMSVRFKDHEASKVKGISLSCDLSREGLKLNSDLDIERGTVLDLEIDIPDDPKPVVSTAEVVWSRRAKEGDRSFEQGIRFLQIDPVDKFRVLDYAYNNWLDSKVIDFSDPENLAD